MSSVTGETSSLGCSFCKKPLADSAKLIIDCDAKICHECYSQLDPANRFSCLSCGQTHTMPESGLVDIWLSTKDTSFEPQKRQKTEKLEKLKHLLDDIHERLRRLETVDQQYEVNLFCDELMCQVALAVESAHENIERISQTLFKNIENYREDLMRNIRASQIRPRESKQNERVKYINIDNYFADQLDTFESKLKAYLDPNNSVQVPTDQDVDLARVQGERCLKKIKEAEETANDKLFANNRMVFRVNETLLTSKDFLGALDYQAQASGNFGKRIVIFEIQNSSSFC